MPENTVSVCRPGKWGNPYKVTPERDARAAVAAFEQAVLRGLPSIPFTIAEVRGELRGKNLACYCKPGSPCHADVLLRIANEGEPTDESDPVFTGRLSPAQLYTLKKADNCLHIVTVRDSRSANCLVKLGLLEFCGGNTMCSPPRSTFRTTAMGRALLSQIRKGD